PLFPGDRKDIVKRWFPLLAASLVLLLFACKKPVAPDRPSIAIELVMPGATAEMLERSAVEPVEEAVAPFVRGIESRSELDHAILWLEVDDVDRAIADVQRALPLRALPAELEPPMIRKLRKDDAPVLWLAIRGNQPPAALSQLVRDEIVPELERL